MWEGGLCAIWSLAGVIIRTARHGPTGLANSVFVAYPWERRQAVIYQMHPFVLVRVLFIALLFPGSRGSKYFTKQNRISLSGSNDVCEAGEALRGAEYACKRSNEEDISHMNTINFVYLVLRVLIPVPLYHAAPCLGRYLCADTSSLFQGHWTPRGFKLNEHLRYCS